jgi:hypothetical protein
MSIDKALKRNSLCQLIAQSVATFAKYNALDGGAPTDRMEV